MSDQFVSSQSTLVCAQEWHDTTVVINCSGVVDMLTTPDLERLVATALEKQPTAVIVNLTDTSMFASCGMSLLVETHERLPEDVPLVVVADGPVTRRPLELVGLAAFLTIRPTLDAAFEELSASAV
ncbi:STAS domain-containing protein [Mycolicibacterium diernhoferi]|uniref:Anti-anti-sigma factor n=1 Tax=Mycolicibacterium diernhoferi TaxID=1801 RepID=A0A1Q4HL66_9MYCO|nr:STAS domain-containing protein [Mycolicibacterium diernhoferi]OJZ68225.1 anti-anti-sigma factor [Mycolicibacterium diernhoferi]OPE55492.1 anti-anti-sigma factor [Mycolicibacterium diernhoferi]PEG56215.1 anti-sigma factor antagonist [Mycolicibacterium diernhoferi]QYL21278.1 STAS domain-containing protein [Mycolicibacterium diernhoferi]